MKKDDLEKYTPFLPVITPIALVGALGIGGYFLARKLEPYLTNYIHAITGNVEKVANQINETNREVDNALGQGELECEGETFPSYTKWIKKNPGYTITPPIAKAKYELDKKHFKDDCKRRKEDREKREIQARLDAQKSSEHQYHIN